MTEERRFYLREWRIHRGLTQEQLGELVGTTKGRISEYERGESNGGRRYNETILEKAARALDCEPWQLLGQDPEQSENREGEERSQVAEIVNVLSRLPKDRRDQAHEIIKTFEDKKEA